MNKITLTSPIWSNIAYLFVWFAPVAIELQVVISLLGVASALFHWGELLHKVDSEGNPLPYSKWSQTYYDSFGYVAQRLDVVLIYTVFMMLFALPTGFIQATLFVWLFLIFADLLNITHRFVYIGISGILASIGLAVAGAWIWLIIGLIGFCIALYIREDAYTGETAKEIKYGNRWHAIWHIWSSLSLILYATGASL